MQTNKKCFKIIYQILTVFKWDIFYRIIYKIIFNEIVKTGPYKAREKMKHFQKELG